MRRAIVLVLGLVIAAGVLRAATMPRIRIFAPLPSGGSPRNPAVSAGGLVYFTEPAANRIGEIDPASGRVTELRVPTRNAWPDGITAGPGPWMTFAERSAGKIGQFLPTGHVFREIPVPDGTDPHLAVVVGDIVYFTAPQAGALGALDPATGAGAAYVVPARGSHPDGIVQGPGPALYFCDAGADSLDRFELTNHRFTQYPIPTAGAAPRRLALAGNLLYFTEYGAGKLGSFDPATRRFVEWNIPGGSATHPEGIVVDGSGTVWIAQRAALTSFDRVSGHFQVVPVGRQDAVHGIPGDDGITIANPPDENGNLWIALEKSRTLAVVTPH